MMQQQALQHTVAAMQRILEESGSFAGTATVDLGTETCSVELSPQRFSELQPAAAATAAAVDGSSIRALDGLSFTVSIHRAAAVVADTDDIRDTQKTDMQAAVLSSQTIHERFGDAYRELSDALPPSLPETVEDVTGALRGLREQALAREVLERLHPGDLCLLDGALYGHRWLQPVVDETCRMAAEQGVHLAGVSKRSDLAAGGVPLLYMVKRRGDVAMPEQRWQYPLSEERGIYTAKLHPAAPYAFRVDVNPLDEAKGQMLRQLAALSDDVTMLGYPYPLAAAHRAAVITAGEASYQRRLLRERMLQEGMTRDDWEGLFYDYHAYLE